MRIVGRSPALVMVLVIAGLLVVLVAIRSDDGAEQAAIRNVEPSGEPNFDIYTVDVATGESLRLTHDPRRDVDPEWSPDGTQIVFVRFSEENLHDLYLMDANGSNERVLLGGPTDEIKPTWSPDGRTIAFMSDRSSFGDLFTIDVATGEVQVKRIAPSPLGAQFPAWSPKGDEIAFVATDKRARKTRLFTVAPDGSNNHVVRVFDRCCRWLPHVEWSSDGERLLVTWQPRGQADLWMMRSDGHGDLLRLTTGTAGDGFGSFSPTGDEIVFQTNRHNTDGDDLYVISADGSAEHPLLRTPWIEANPDWSPGGDVIAFDSIRGT